jgi:nitric oxide dioxygenase
MTPDQLLLVAETARAVGAEPDRFSAIFYARLFERAPHIRALFPQGTGGEGRRLADEIAALASELCDLPAFVERTRALGARHRGYGVRPEHYEAAGEALLGALADFLGPRWTPAVMLAWERVYRLIAETMLEGSGDVVFRERPA